MKSVFFETVIFNVKKPWKHVKYRIWEGFQEKIKTVFFETHKKSWNPYYRGFHSEISSFLYMIGIKHKTKIKKYNTPIIKKWRINIYYNVDFVLRRLQSHGSGENKPTQSVVCHSSKDSWHYKKSKIFSYIRRKISI